MQSTATVISKLQNILAARPNWKGIDEIVAACERASIFDRQFRHDAEKRAKKTFVRRLIHSLKDDEGFPLFASITIFDEKGEPKRVYKQELLFDPEDYKSVVKYHLGLSEHHKGRAEGYIARCARKHGPQLWFPNMRPNDDETPPEVDDIWKPKKPR